MTAEPRLRKIRLILLDVDGVLTAGDIILGDGGEYKAFNVQDGFGIRLALDAGLLVGILTGRTSRPVEMRARELRLPIVIQGAQVKLPAYEQMLKEQNLRDEEVCYMGDDLLDTPVLKRVGLSAAPADARPEVRRMVHWVSEAPGGRGAVRELVEFILKGQDKFAEVLRARGLEP